MCGACAVARDARGALGALGAREQEALNARSIALLGRYERVALSSLERAFAAIFVERTGINTDPPANEADGKSGVRERDVIQERSSCTTLPLLNHVVF